MSAEDEVPRHRETADTESRTEGHPQPDQLGRMRCVVCGEFTARIRDGEYRHAPIACIGGVS